MNFLEGLRNIDTFIFDVDGVLTDGSVTVLENGSLIRTMNIKDGYALKLAVMQGYHVCIITGGKSPGVRIRLERLGITDIYDNVGDKMQPYEELVAKYHLDEGRILYMGDDIPDYHVMRRVGMPTCPADAAPELFEIAQYVSPLGGGRACVRDVIEKVMKIQGKWLL